jgi:hypothetical protein
MLQQISRGIKSKVAELLPGWKLTVAAGYPANVEARVGDPRKYHRLRV